MAKNSWKYVMGSVCLIGVLTACSAQAAEVPVEKLVESPEGNMTIETLETETESQVTQTQTESEMESETESEETVTQEEASIQETEQKNNFWDFTDGELEARKEQQRNFQEARELLFTLDNSIDKTEKIYMMDKQIIENNAYSFYDKNIVFIGDSITEGVGAAVDPERGNKLSYAVYAGDFLHAGQTINNGKGGRMFSDYGGEEYSLMLDYGNCIFNAADIFVVFCGVNDYLTEQPDKRFGDISNTLSTAGYCGAVRNVFQSLQRDFPGKPVFVVLMYDFDKEVTATYSDITYQPTLNDYLEVQRVLAKEYGFHVIDLYSQGYMSCRTQEEKDYFLDDFVHPKDRGSIYLGAHIAAEISYYMSQNN